MQIQEQTKKLVNTAVLNMTLIKQLIYICGRQKTFTFNIQVKIINFYVIYFIYLLILPLPNSLYG